MLDIVAIYNILIDILNLGVKHVRFILFTFATKRSTNYF